MLHYFTPTASIKERNKPVPQKIRGRPKKIVLQEAQDSLNSAMSAGMNTKGASDNLLAEPPKKRGKYANYSSRENFQYPKAVIQSYHSCKTMGTTQDNTYGDDDDETALCFGFLVESASPSTIRT
jgi:hypothetical protein